MQLSESELILNRDGSVYHLNLLPEHICNTIITVGDPERVSEISKYFKKIHFRFKKREFSTVTGEYKQKLITVISTGIGTDNIDIVLNELDALVNINLKKRTRKAQHTSLKIIRIGTSGAIQPEIEVDTTIITKSAIGMDNLLQFYDSKQIQNKDLSLEFNNHLHKNNVQLKSYAVSGNGALLKKFEDKNTIEGITVTNSGFYAPQGRSIRLPLRFENYNAILKDFEFQTQKITNFEMETSGIYGLSALLGHQAVSINAILANRATQTFSKNPTKSIEKLIQKTLNQITNLEE